MSPVFFSKAIKLPPNSTGLTSGWICLFSRQLINPLSAVDIHIQPLQLIISKTCWCLTPPGPPADHAGKEHIARRTSSDIWMATVGWGFGAGLRHGEGEGYLSSSFAYTSSELGAPISSLINGVANGGQRGGPTLQSRYRYFFLLVRSPVLRRRSYFLRIFLLFIYQLTFSDVRQPTFSKRFHVM